MCIAEGERGREGRPQAEHEISCDESNGVFMIWWVVLHVDLDVIFQGNFHLQL